MPAGFTVGIAQSTAVDLKRVSADLKRADRNALKHLRKRIRATAEPTAADVRQAALAIPAKGPKSTGLRRRIAKGVKVRVTAQAVSITATEALSKEMEGTEPWRHEVYGNRRVWVSQQPHPFFNRTIERRHGRIVREVERVLDDIQKDAGF